MRFEQCGSLLFPVFFVLQIYCCSCLNEKLSFILLQFSILFQNTDTIQFSTRNIQGPYILVSPKINDTVNNTTNQQI